MKLSTVSLQTMKALFGRIGFQTIDPYTSYVRIYIYIYRYIIYMYIYIYVNISYVILNV